MIKFDLQQIWLQALSESEKRNLIKSAIKMPRYKGAKYAFEEIFNTLNIVGNFKEWFNYGGKAYYERKLNKVNSLDMHANV